MRILLIGNTGQVGWELQRTLCPMGEIIALDYPAVDLLDLDRTRKLISQIQPQAIINAAAYTDVDHAETEQELAFGVNATAPGWLAEEARKIGAVFVHYSTDYVFDGGKVTAYTEKDLPKPINVYGKSKLAGEQLVEAADGAYLIFRTSWVYSLRKKSFVTQVLRWGREQKEMRVVDDQVGSPTWCRLLAEVTAQILAKANGKLLERVSERKGIYHLAGKGSANRYEWAMSILTNDPQKDQQIVERIQPAKSIDFPTSAGRPANSSLACEKISDVFGVHLPAWNELLPLALSNS